MGKPRMTRRDKWAKRECVVRYHDYKDRLKDELPGYQLPGSLSIDFYLSMPESWSQAKRQRCNFQPHQQKPDIDNLLKGFMDAFDQSDQHVYEVHARKFWAEAGAIEISNDL